MLKFHKCKLNDSLLDQWIHADVNVLLIGEKGVGKSAQILNAFDRNNLKYAYFSGATLDPWIHLLGIPKAKVQEDGTEKMEFILPENLDNDVQAIFCDEWNRCFVGDTMIQLVDGYSVPIKELMDMDEFYVYSYDINNKKTSVGRGHSCRITQQAAPIIKLTLDDGSIIRCTKDHKFLCSDGVYREAGTLDINQSLMAAYKKYNKDGYEEVKSTIEPSWKYTYWLADEYNILNNKYDTILEGNRVSRHHIDHNKYNNNPNNITRLDYIEHIRHHGNDTNTCRNGGISTHKKHPNHYEKTIGMAENRELALKNSIISRNVNKKDYILKLSSALTSTWNDAMKKSASSRAIGQWQNGQFNNINRRQAIRKTHLTHTCKILYNILQNNIITEELYETVYSTNRPSFSRSFKLLKPKTILTYFDNDFSKFSEHYKKFVDSGNILLNHRVISIENDGFEDVYDFTVDTYHNFLLGAGVFVHNCHKVVRNALLELQQFKSINGRKFPNLKIVWGAVNPPKDENEVDSLDYDVDELDPAQLDRFHIIVELPNEPDLKYFKSQFGEYHGKVLVDWWKEQTKESKKILSPRRLDYIGQSFRKGLDIKFLLPVSANPVDLIKKLSSDETEEMIKKMFENPTDEEMIDFIKNDKNFLKYKSKLKEPRYWKYWKHSKKEFVADEIKTNENFSNYTIYQVCKNEKYYIDQVLEIASSNPNMEMIKLIKVLKEQKYVPPKEESISSFIGNAAPFPTIDTLSGYGSGVDNFSNVYPISNYINLNTYNTSNMNINMNTQERRKLIDILEKCIHVVKNKRQVITFVISCLSSMQKGTISSTKQFLPIFGTACVMAKETLSKAEMQIFVQDISKYKDKLSINRIEDFIEFLLGKSSQNNQTPVPEEFLKKLKDIRAMISVFSSENTLKQII